MPTIKVKGEEHEIQALSEIYIKPIIAFMNGIEDEYVLSLNHTTGICEIIKEILIPTLPATVIDTTSTGKYFFNLNSIKEIGLFLMDIIEVYANTREATADSKEAIEHLKSEVKKGRTELARI